MGKRLLEIGGSGGRDGTGHSSGFGVRANRERAVRKRAGGILG
jgi:hypothetical protein